MSDENNGERSRQQHEDHRLEIAGLKIQYQHIVDSIDKLSDSLEHSFDRLEQKIDQRLQQRDEAIGALRSDMRDMDTKLERRIGKVDERVQSMERAMSQQKGSDIVRWGVLAVLGAGTATALVEIFLLGG